MKKLLLSTFTLLVLTLIAFLALGERLGEFLAFDEERGKKRELIKELTPLACDLNKEPCEYEFKGRKVRVEFKEKPLQALIENEIFVENLGEFENLNARIYGLNMYMGDVLPSFEKVGQGSFRAAFVPSACVLETMRFRVEFFEKKKALNFYFDFDMKR